MIKKQWAYNIFITSPWRLSPLIIILGEVFTEKKWRNLSHQQHVSVKKNPSHHQHRLLSKQTKPTLMPLATCRYTTYTPTHNQASYPSSMAKFLLQWSNHNINEKIWGKIEQNRKFKVKSQDKLIWMLIGIFCSSFPHVGEVYGWLTSLLLAIDEVSSRERPWQSSCLKRWKKKKKIPKCTIYLCIVYRGIGQRTRHYTF